MSEVAEQLSRPEVLEIDRILGEKIRVCEDGFIRVIDYMGDDTAIVQAARVSYGSGTKSVRSDAGLIDYLMANRHTTPFEMCEIKLHVRVPMDVWRQWIRHRTASVNEYSTRYSVAIDSTQTTRPSDWRRQSKSNRQGSESSFLEDDIGERLSLAERDFHTAARSVYNERLEHGVAREQARKDLPLSTYTEAYWKINLHNLLHFLALRLDSHAQVEIRDYANAIAYSVVAKWVPQTWRSFCNHRLNAMHLSDDDQALIKLLFKQGLRKLGEELYERGWLSSQQEIVITSRQFNTFELKVQRLFGRPSGWSQLREVHWTRIRPT